MTAPVWQQDAQSTPGTSTTAVVTITPVAAGHLLMIAFGAYTAGTSGITLVSVTATNGNTPVQVFPLQYNGASFNIVGGLYCIPNVLAGATTITVTVSTAVQDFGVIVDEYSGASSTFDGTGQGLGNSSSTDTTTNFTTTNPTDVIYCACCGDDQGISTAGSGFTLRSNLSTNDLSGTEDQTVSSAGSYAGTWVTKATPHNYVLYAVALQPPLPSVPVFMASAEW
jgi:hypothetical protein